MRTLLQSGYMNQGISPRVFVRVFDSAGTTLFQQGTKATGAYEDRITTFGAINQSIRPEGGMAEVSGASVNRLVLDERLTLCSEAELEPQIQTSVHGSGVVYSADVNYITARNPSGGVLITPAVVVGRNYSVGADIHTVYRGFLQFTIPAGMLTCEDAFLQFTGMGDFSVTDFQIQGFAGEWSNLNEGGAIFALFDGHEGSGDYTGTNLLETWTTAEYGGTVYLRLNAAGRAAVLAKTGTIFRIMLVSEKDAVWTGHSAGASGNEYVQFEAASARLCIRYNSITLDNQNVEYLYGLEPLPGTISAATLDRVWTGVVDSWELTDRELSLECRQNDHKKNPLVPDKIITLADFPNCPQENLGKAIPVVYGSTSDALMGAHEAGIGYEKNFVAHTLTNEEIGLFDYFPCPVVDPGNATGESPIIVLVSNRTIKRAYLGVPAVWDSAAKAWVRLVCATSPVQGTTYQYIYISPDRRIIGWYNGITYQDADIYEDFIGPSLSIIPTYVRTSSGVTSPEAIYGAGVSLNSVDDFVIVGFSSETVNSASEKIEICFSLTTTGNCEIYCKIIGKDQLLSGGDGVIASSGIPGFSTFTSAAVDFSAAGVTTADRIWIYGSFGGVSSAISSVDSAHVLKIPTLLSSSSLEFKIIKTTDIVHTFTNIMKNAIGSVDVVLDATDYLTKTLDNYFIQIYKFAHTSGEAQVSYLQVKYYSQNGSLREIGLDKLGTVYGSWIDAAGRSNSSNSGDLIENPAHVIEAFARNEMSLSTSEIDTAAFDTAATALTGMKFAFQLNDRKPARELLDDMAMQARLLLWWDEQDRLTCKKIDSTAGFPHRLTGISGDLQLKDIPRNEDIFTVTGDPVSGVFTTHPIMSGLNIRLMDMADVKNDFVLKYKRNYATNDYGAVLTCNKDAETLDDTKLSGTTGAALVALCDACYDRIIAVQTLTVEAWAIRDEATATVFMQHLVQWFTKRRVIIEFTAGIDALEFEPGDFINVRDTRIADLFGTAVMNIKKWCITGFHPNLNDHTIAIEAIEVD